MNHIAFLKSFEYLLEYMQIRVYAQYYLLGSIKHTLCVME